MMGAMGARDRERPARAWVLNLDAEHELEGGRRYAPTRRLRALVERERERLIGALVAPGDIVLDRDPDAEELARGRVGLAWSPTPRALARLAAAGARVAAAPEVEVLRRVNARPFAAALRAPLAGASFAKHVAATLEEALERLARPAPDGWLVRRAFGAAGRGRRRIAAGRPSAAELAWLRASLRRGPLTLEPWVRVTREMTRSAWVDAAGRLEIAPPCFQTTTAEGAWTATAPSARGEVDRADDAVLQRTVETVGRALHAAGYAGPFGIDAYRHRLGDREVLNPLSEINARFTMDWTTGLAARHGAAGALELAARVAQSGSSSASASSSTRTSSTCSSSGSARIAR